MIGDDQRRVAGAVVVGLCLAWAALGVAGIVTAYATPTGMDGTGGYLLLLAVAGAGAVVAAVLALVAGVSAIRRFRAEEWRRLLVAMGLASAGSASGGAMLVGALPVLGVLLLLQAAVLPCLVAVLRPVS